MIGFVLQWPTIPTLIMFPVLVYVYARLARSEEHAFAEQFGQEWNDYAARTPDFVPHNRTLTHKRSARLLFSGEVPSRVNGHASALGSQP